MDHQVPDGADGLQVVLLVSGADLLEPGEGLPELGKEGGHGVDGGAGLLEELPPLRAEVELGGGRQRVHQDCQAP